MSEKQATTESKPVFSASVCEVTTAGAKDHKIFVATKVGGLNLNFESTFDEIRDFFTKRREKKTAATLKSV